MALRINFLYPNTFPSKSKKSKINWAPSTINLKKNSPKLHKLTCTNKDMSDIELALDFATEVENINTLMLQREEALKKSKQLLFLEFCKYKGLKSEEMKKKWKRLSEDDKWVLVKDFVVEWAAHFHPLSAKSVKELVDEYLVENSPESISSAFFPGLKRLMGFDNE